MRIFNTQGRSRRTEYLFDQIIFTLAFILIGSVTLAISERLTSHYDETFEVLFIFVLFIPYISINIISDIKRLHDLNSNGSQVFFLLIPFYNLFLLFRLVFEKGTHGINNFGPDPRINLEKDYRKQIISKLVEIALLIVLIWSVSEIEQNRNLKEVKEFVQHPKENHYLIIESDEDPEFKYFLIKITDITSDSCEVYYSNYSYSSTYDAENSLTSYEFEFADDYSYWGTLSNDFLEEIKIVEIIE